MNRFRLLFVSVILLLSACVPNRKITFLQKDDIRKKDMPIDSVVRNYDMDVLEYKIQPLDLLYIKVESLTPEDFDFISKLDAVPQTTSGGGGGGTQGIALRYGYLVDANGEMEYPILGKIKVAGLTVFQAQTLLIKLLETHLSLPGVRVRLLNFRFTILGEVLLEQQVTLTNTRVTLMEAIGMAGGLTDLADRSKVKIVRQTGNKLEVYYLNLLDENLVKSQSYFIQQNDVIIVPPLRQRPYRKYFAQNLNVFITSITTLLLVIALLQK